MALLTATMISWQPHWHPAPPPTSCRLTETIPAFVSTGDYYLDYKDYDFDLSNFDPNYIGLRVNRNVAASSWACPPALPARHWL